MKLLRNNNIFKLCFDLETKTEIKYDGWQNIVGFYLKIGNIISGFLTKEETLKVLWDNEVFEINKDLKAVLIDNNNNTKHFYLYKNSILLFDFEYELEEPIPNLFGGIEDDDFDWGLFLANRINNPENYDYGD